MNGPANNSADSIIEPLTRREREILALLAQGLSAPEIAEKLTLAVSSVKSHIQHVYGKLGVNSRRQAVARARELGLEHGASPLPQALPHAAAQSIPRHNLPQQLTRLIGREREIAEIRQVLVDGQQPPARLVTLVGPGGTGKTRLSLAIAGEVLAAYGDGVWLVEVAPLADPELLAQTVAASLGLRVETAGANPNPAAVRPLLALLTEFMQAKHCLLVLDNCEHLVEACARLGESLLRACPRLQILATSREALGVVGEAVWPVPGLALPPATLPAGMAPEQAGEYAAVQLFAERAGAARPGFSVTAQNSASLVQVCRQLDGLPLAIELAAARVAVLPVEQIVALLAAHARFRLLTGGGRTALPRHQTLLATIDWSYQLLSEPERNLLRRLPVFAGGWTLAAAEAVCADPTAEAPLTETGLPAGAVLDALSRLAAKSLVISEPTEGVEARFHMLETIREYAHGKLEESGEAAAVCQRHLEFFLDLAERAEPETRGRDQVAWYDRVEADHDNLRRALEWAVHRRETAGGLRLASALHHFWDVRGYSNEAYAWFNRLLAGHPAPQPSAAWALALAWAAHFGSCTPDWSNGVADSLCQASLALSRELGEAGQVSAAHALLELGRIRFGQASPESAVLIQESLALFEQVGDDWGRATALQAIGFTARQGGNYQQAVAAYEQSQAIFDGLGDLGGFVRVLNDLGELAAWHGEYRRACELHEAALTHFRQLRDWLGNASALLDLADTLINLGQFERAATVIDEGMALVRSAGHLRLLPNFVGYQALIALAYGDYDQAAALQAESRKLAIELGDSRDNWAWMEYWLASIVRAQGNPAQAVTMIENIQPFYRAGGHKWWMAYSQRALGEALRDEGEYERATALSEASLAWFRERGVWLEVTALLLQLGGLARRQGDHPRAANLLGESLRRCQASELRPLMAACLAELAYRSIGLAESDNSLAEAEHAARLLGACEALREAMSLPVPPVDQAERVEYDHAVLSLRSLLGDARLDAVWAEGEAMGAEPAVNLALAALKDDEQ